MSVVYQKAFDHLDASSRPMQFLDRHLLHHQADPTHTQDAQVPHTQEPQPTRASPLAHHSHTAAAYQQPSAVSAKLQPSTRAVGESSNLPQQAASSRVSNMSQSAPVLPNQPFRAGLTPYLSGGNATPSPLQKFGVQQQAMSTSVQQQPTNLQMPLISSSADSTPNSNMVPAAVVPTGHGVANWIQQQPTSSSVPIVTQSVVQPALPTMSAHHVSATPSAKIVIPMQATATAFTTHETTQQKSQQDRTNVAGVQGGTGQEARSGSTGAPQILKKQKRKHAKKVRARPSTCGCC